MESPNISSIQKLLKLSGTIQRDIISILGSLSGYSKRRSLLEAQLRKSGHSASGIEQSIERLLNIGLLIEKSGDDSSRIALTKEIWNTELKIVEAIFSVTQLLGRDRRSDVQSSTVIREVKSRLAERIDSGRSGKLYYGVANAALLSLPDWALVGGVVVRATSTVVPETLFNRKEKKTEVSLPKSTPIVSKAESPKVDLSPDGIGLLSFDVLTIVENLRQQLAGLGMSVIASENHCRVTAKMPLGRQQQVFVTVRHDPMRRKVFWLYTICGALDADSDFLEQALIENNNDCGPMRVTALKIGGKSHLGCCASVSAETGWDKELPQVVCLLANLGDHIEEKYWTKDRY